jgi:hypothetical protein
MWPKYTPTIHAKAIARTPTFIRETQLTTMAMRSAMSESQARLIRVTSARPQGGRLQHR